MNWQQFTMQLGSLSPELVEEIFERHGACSVTLSDAGDDPVLEPSPGTTPLWTETQITGLFDAGSDLAKLHEDLLDSLQLKSLPGYRVESLVEREWEREWLKDFRPMRFGNRLWVCPEELSVDAMDAVVVKLDPGLAFGTGTHPTTALCLAWLDSIDLRDCRILDYGCGSGILCIAALLLGATSAVAMDIDSQAITATRQNAEKNGVANKVSTALRDDDIDSCMHGQFDVLVANILASPLVENAARISSRLKSGGMLALSGILVDQAETVRDAYDRWIEFEPIQQRDDWVVLTGRRN